MNTVLDAKGNIPAPLTDHEKKWRDKLNSGTAQKRYEALKERQALPLDKKIELSMERIEEFGKAFDWHVASSYSGGFDSTVMIDIIKKVRPGIPNVYCNTGLEYPEINQQVARTENVTVMRPKMPFHRVVKEVGWPVASKKTALGLNVLRNPTGNNQNIYRLYDIGINRFGEKVEGYKVAQQWRFLLDAPFKISSKCCDIMKKEPMHRYEKKTGRVQFVGILADESKGREKTYVETGCNAFDAKTPRSWPLAFWTRQDILEYIRREDLPYASVYGHIVETPHGLDTTGVQGTGCVFCLFGMQLETGQNRIQQLARTHPRLWSYCMDKLGMREVLRYIRDNAKPGLANKFKCDPEAVSKVLTLPGM
ncbi:phosphoadenosine phosphosulfate reductase family protein [Maridesulfovibrio sp.]|uniref:phosphoadenosine phosphosulfate reductase domain-containing protein n=1 Tax=Maridesulfovibrio sp. TaxID=2795000 RepID=UPI0029CA8D31|nr:phosphoadenosine phosphosulfate reductase family protein [Maridesulfovibrio sp.]